MKLLPIRALSSAVALTAVAAGACTGVTTVHTSAPAAGPAAPAPTATTQLRYAGALITVPAGWPVYDLTADPHRCARLDVHAVYLGHQGPDAVCPARLLGKTETVQLEPMDGVTAARVLPNEATTEINGQPASLQPGAAASHSIQASFPALKLVVTASFDTDEPLARSIVDSVRAGSG